MSQAMTTLTATAARNGEPTAIMPKTISKTPHTMDNVEACRTMSPGVFCAMEPSLRNRANPISKSRFSEGYGSDFLALDGRGEPDSGLQQGGENQDASEAGRPL